MTPEVNVVLLNLPTKTSEAVTENEDGSYTIIINSRFDREHQLQSYEHAMKHILDGDFDLEDGNVQEIEARQHETAELADQIADLPKTPADEFAKYLNEQIAKLKKEKKQVERKLKRYESYLAFCDGCRDDAVLDRRELKVYQSV